MIDFCLKSSEEYFSYIDDEYNTWWLTCPLRVLRVCVFGLVKIKN